MLGTMVKEDRLRAPQYMPTNSTFTGCFQIDKRVACALKSDPLQSAFDGCFPLFLNQDPPRVVVIEEDGVVIMDVPIYGWKPLEQRDLLAKFWFGALMPQTYPVVFVGQPPSATTNTIAAIASADPPALPAKGLPAELYTPPSEHLKEIVESDLWSLRKLEPILGPSHQQIARIARGSAASPEVVNRIDDLYRFYKRLRKLVDGNAVAMNRLLNTPSQRDGKTAQEWLESMDFRKAFTAVMDVASPALGIIETESLPLRWYDEPSIAVEDLEQRNR